MKANEIDLTPEFIRQIADLYHDMEAAYDRSAKVLNFSCSGCPDNCCDSFFLHHTYTEWAYLWYGLKKLDDNLLHTIIEKASDYIIECEASLAKGERPIIMCPLNSEGRCALYLYRMMICRLHGVPAAFTKPDGQQLHFPGCFRCQEHISTKNSLAPLDRTRFFQRLVNLEIELLGNKKPTAPRVKLTLAQIIVEGPPKL